jgi:hypothetical protein
MKTFGEVTYPSYKLIQGKGLREIIQPERILTGWNRGTLIGNTSCIIFEDVEGMVHVVDKKLFSKGEVNK